MEGKGKEIILAGEVRSVSDRAKDGKLFMRQYQIEIMTGKSEVGNVIFCDYDLERRFEVGKIIPPINVRPAISEFKGLHIEFHSIGKNNNNGNAPAGADKKQNIKV